MRTVHVVTHPEATHHTERLVGGWYDADLTERGVLDADRIAHELADRVTVPATVVSSDLIRTRRTAEAIAAALGVEPTLDARLREQSYGVAGGLPPGRFPMAPLPPGGDRLRHDDGVEGSETLLDVATRTYAAMADLLDPATDHDLVLVTHGGTATYVIAAWIGMPLTALGAVRFRVPPGSISVLRAGADGAERQVVSLGEVAHLAPT